MLSLLTLPSAVQRALVLPVLLLLALAVGRAVAGRLRRVPVHSGLERLLICWLLGLITCSWIGTVLAGLGLFRPWLFIATLALVSGASLWQERRERSAAMAAAPPLDTTPRAVPWLVVLGLAMAGFAYGRPAETYFLYDDSSVYTIAGALLARTGSLFGKLDSFWRVSDSFLRQFYTIDTFGLLARHYGPFYQWLPGSQSLEIGFLPLPKVWVAISIWLFGANFATWATPFFGIAGLAVLYGFVRRSLGWLAALAAVALLAISLPELWFARYPISEIFAQTFWIGGLYLGTIARQNAQDAGVARRLAIWSALALATLTILRFEALLLLVPAAILMLIGWSRQPGSWSQFSRVWVLMLALAGGLGTAISIGVARHYVFAQSLATLTPSLLRFAILGILLLLVAVGWLLYRRENLSRAILALPRIAAWLPLVVAAGWLIWALIAIWQLLTRGTANTVVGWLFQYWSPLGLVLSVAGGLWLLWRQTKKPDGPELVVALGLATALLLGYAIAPMVAPTHPWAIRRLIPMIFPVLALAAGALLAAPAASLWPSRGSEVRRRELAWSVAALGMLAFLGEGLVLARSSVPLVWHEELGGYWQQLQTVAEALPTGAVLLLEPGPDGAHIGQAFELLFGHPSFVLTPDALAGADSQTDRLIREAMQQHRRVFLLITDNVLKWHPEQWQLAGQGEHRILTSGLAAPVGRPPNLRDFVTRIFEFDTYEVLPKEGSADIITLKAHPISVTASAGAYPYLREGFYGWDMGVEDRLIRWTDGDGRLLLPWPAAAPSAAASFCLKLEVAGGRPPDQESARLEVEVQGVPRTGQDLPRDGRPLTLSIPVDSAANQGHAQLEIRLKSNTFQAGRGTSGPRPVGVALYGFELSPYENCSGANG